MLITIASRGRRRRASARFPLLLATALAAASHAQDAAPSSTAMPKDGPAYPVSQLELAYIDPNPLFPKPEEMANTEVELMRVSDGFVQPRAGSPVTRLRIGDLPSMGTTSLYESALRAINQQLVFEFNERDFHAIVVSPLPEDIDRRSGRDLRAAGVTKMRLGIYAGRVKDVHTNASGDGEVAPEERIDREEHKWIRDGSPLQASPPQDLVRKDLLDSYLAQLNRHPTRRVDVELRPAGVPGGLVVDYFVAETKPWWAYAQVDDTGTEQTTELRQRFGGVHSNVTGRDDLVQFDYITGNFSEVNAVSGSYEIPFDRSQRLRARFFTVWSNYDATVSAIFGNDQFSSKQLDAGGQLIGTLFQHDELFVDAIGGLQYEHISVDSNASGGGYTASEDFALGLAGLRLDRTTQASSLRGEFSVLHNFGGLAGTDGDTLTDLGRQKVDEEDFTLMRWNSDISFFVEPALSPRSWRDPKVLAARSMAHELAFSLRGQHAFDRLIPQQTYVAGGFLSVRGYPESATAGDNVQTYTAEYRLHVPRLLAPDVRPKRLPGVGAFHARPKYDYTFPDWDLILRGFVDYAHVDYLDIDQVLEQEERLLGVGFGAEVRFKRFVTARVDYGFALKEVDLGNNESVDNGDDQVHFSVTLLY